MRTPSLLTISALLACILFTPGVHAGEYVSAPYAAPLPYIPGVTDHMAATLHHAANGTYQNVVVYADDAVFGSQVPIVTCLTMGTGLEVCHDVTVGHRFFRYGGGVTAVRAWVFSQVVSEELELGGATAGELVVLLA